MAAASVPALSGCSHCPHWWLWAVGWNTPFPPQVALPMLFITAAESQLGQVSKHLRPGMAPVPTFWMRSTGTQRPAAHWPRQTENFPPSDLQLTCKAGPWTWGFWYSTVSCVWEWLRWTHPRALERHLCPYLTVSSRQICNVGQLASDLKATTWAISQRILKPKEPTSLMSQRRI